MLWDGVYYSKLECQVLKFHLINIDHMALYTIYSSSSLAFSAQLRSDQAVQYSIIYSRKLANGFKTRLKGSLHKKKTEMYWSFANMGYPPPLWADW